MKLSDAGLDMIKLAEGWMPTVYMDQAGLPTVAYGHLLTAEDQASDRFDKPITVAEGEAILRADVERFEIAIGKLVKVPLTQNQFDALVDFTFNLGVGALTGSTLLRKLNAGDYAAVPEQLMRWDKIRDPQTGKLRPLAGLTRRRKREADLWVK